MLTSGRVVFTDMEEVHYGKPADQSVAELVKGYGAERVLVMASGTLNRETDEVEKIRRALGNKCVGTFASMPAHSPRSAVIAATAQARDAKADLIVTLGGEGASGFSGDKIYDAPALLITPVDTVGAGDAFVGALAAAIDGGGDLARGLAYGSVAGALACLTPGAQPSLPMKAAIDKRLKDLPPIKVH